jgi:hypothetical protein
MLEGVLSPDKHVAADDAGPMEHVTILMSKRCPCSPGIALAERRTGYLLPLASDIPQGDMTKERSSKYDRRTEVLSARSRQRNVHIYLLPFCRFLLIR